MPLNYQKVQTKKTRGRQILGLKPGIKPKYIGQRTAPGTKRVLNFIFNESSSGYLRDNLTPF